MFQRPFNGFSSLTWLILTITLAACSAANTGTTVVRTADVTVEARTPTEAPAITTTGSPTPTPAPSLTPTLVATRKPAPVPFETPTPTATQLPSETPTPSLTPTYAILRGEVLERSNCRYGPGAPYLYKYGLVPGSNLEVIGRNDLGTWILVRAIGGDNPCWVKATLMDVQGDVMAVEPTYIPLPQSPYYLPPSAVSAVREGEQVSIFWNPVTLRAGDETASPPYLVEAWVCQDGQLVFTPIGSYEAAIKVIDEPGCPEPSHGRVYTVEKHGYSRWREIPWPP